MPCTLKILFVMLVAVAACGDKQDVQCATNSDCDLSGGGSCTLDAASGDRWCAYPDPLCPSGYRYSNVGDGLSGKCVLDDLHDAGMDAHTFMDAHLQDGGTPPEMTLIPGGDFVRGCNQAHEDCTNLNNELPAATITISTFFMDSTEVTQLAYKQCMDASMCTAPDSSSAFDPVGRANYPVGGIQWQQAVDYCTWKSKRLPTEAEWEKASRGTDGREFPWGNVPADCTLAHYLDCTLGDTSSVPVGGKAGDSPTGLKDMAGNILEWTNDWYSNAYYSTSPTTDPQGPSTGQYRVIRGGGFGYGSIYLRSSYRYFATPATSLRQFGFRCAKT
jgi:formylglycine-generating enzyme